MNANNILRDVHPIGSQISGVVTECTDIELLHGFPGGRAKLEDYRSILPYQHLVDDGAVFSRDLIPRIGDSVDTVVFNFVDDTLYLSAKPHDLRPETVAEWANYYAYIESLNIGDQISGFVKLAMPFGLFVDLGSPYVGLIDIGHSSFNGGQQLPYENDKWPQVGDPIRCNIAYFRLHDRQIGLGWIPS